MYISKDFKTDTATLVLFDEASLANKVGEPCDWWTGDDDLLFEERAGNLVFFETGSDGFYKMAVTDEESQVTGIPVKKTNISVPTGTLFFGPGEFLPGDGHLLCEELGKVVVDQGPKGIQVYVSDNQVTLLITEAANEPMGLEQQVLPTGEATGDTGFLKGGVIDFLNSSLEDADGITAGIPGEWQTSIDGTNTWLRCTGAGIELVYNKNKLVYIHLYAEGMGYGGYDFGAYKGNLPENLHFGEEQASIAQRFGKPESGTGLYWGIYRFPLYGLRVGYVKGVLATLNILSLDSEFMQ